MSFTELEREYEAVGVGELIYGIVLELVGRICSKYPEQRYNSGLAWDESSVQELAHEVILNHLIDEGQLDYIFSNTKNVEAVRRLITRQVKRALHKRRAIGPVDRLLARIDKLANAGFIEKVEGAFTTYRAIGSNTSWQPMTAEQQTTAVNAITGIPVIYSKIESSRETQIYTNKTLQTVVAALFDVCPVLTQQEIRGVLEELLTAWAPGNLVPIEDDFEATDQAMTVTATQELDEAASRWVATLTNEECWVYYLRSREQPDQYIAAQIGKARTTVITIKKRVLESAAIEFLAGLDSHQHLDAVLLAQEHCARRLGEEL